MDQIQQQSKRERRPRYLPALDGIRALAVIAVVFYHLNAPWMQGGMIGVTVFFVLSGFLITRLLVGELRGRGKIDLARFWIRRARRLLPAIITLVVAVAALCTLFNHVMLTKMRSDILPSLLFFNNWWQIAQNASYFDALGDPSPLTHFWSLAIEEQFYLVWPPVLFLAYRLGAKRSHVRRGVLIAAAVSAAAMIVLYDPAVDPSRVYYGTDTRVFSLLLGAWIALIPESKLAPRRLLARICGHLGKRPPSRATCRNIFDAAGALALIGLAAIAIFTNGYSAFQYQGGALLCTVLAMALIVSAIPEDGRVTRILSARPLTWLGTRSYGIYLWHFPLLSLMNPVSDISAKPWWVHALQIAVVVAVAELSYRFIETPFRRGALGRTVTALREKQTAPAQILRRHAPLAAVSAAALAIALWGIVFVPPTDALSAEGSLLLQQGDDSGASADGEAGNDSGSKDAADDEHRQPAADVYDVVMIGDSVSVRTIPKFQETFPFGHIDAAKNRQFGQGIEIYRSLVDEKRAGDVLVFALGTNGPISDAQIDELMDIAGKKREVFFVNTRSPQAWVGAVNDAIARAAERHKNAHVIDWYGASENRSDLFDGDGTHLNDAGVDAYIDLIRSAISDFLPLHLEDPEVRETYASRANDFASQALGSVQDGVADRFKDADR